jgi:RNA polymerase sigma-70 factor (ECF subfamily)
MISREPSTEEDARWIRTILSQRDAPPAEDCFRRLLEKYWRVVAVLAANKLGDRREAEDIAQEAFFRAFRSLESLAEPAAFLGWLLRIAQNLVTDKLRARKRTVSLDSLGVGGEPGVAARKEAPEFERTLESAEETAEAMQALSDLPEKYREVVALKYLKGLDGRAMAKLLGEPEGTNRNRLFRALAKLRASLEQKKAHKP